MGFMVFVVLTVCFTTLISTSNADNIEEVNIRDVEQTLYKDSFYTRNSHLKNHTYKLLSRRSIEKNKDHPKLIRDDSVSVRSTTLGPPENSQDVTKEVGSESTRKDEIIEGSQSPSQETVVDGGQRTREENVVVGGQRAAQYMAPEGAAPAQEAVIDTSQGAAAQETDHSESHEPTTDVTVHKISPQAEILNSHSTDVTLPTTLHGKENSFIGIESRVTGSKNLSPQAMMFNEATTAASDGQILPKHYADTSHHMLPPLSHLAQNVSDVDIEEETPAQMLQGTEDVKNVDRVTGLQEIKEVKQVPKHLSDEKIAAHIEDDEKVFSITHPLLKPNEYNENLKEMLEKTKADLSAI